MLLGRVFAYSDTHRYRIGPNYLQLPVNQHRVADANTYTFDGPMAYEHTGDQPVYAPNSYGRGYSDETGPVEDRWETDGEMVRAAYTLRAEDDDFGQAGTLVREVWDDAARERFVGNVAGHILGGVSGRAAAAGVRLLEERRPGHRQAHRGGRARRSGREGPGPRSHRARGCHRGLLDRRADRPAGRGLRRPLRNATTRWSSLRGEPGCRRRRGLAPAWHDPHAASGVVGPTATRRRSQSRRRLADARDSQA